MTPALAVALFLGLAGPCAAQAADASDFGQALAAHREGRAGQAAQLFRRLADAGDPEAQYNIAVLYLAGHGLPRNDREALYWAWRARLSGIAPAAALIARITAQQAGADMGPLADRLLNDLSEDLRHGEPRAVLGAATLAAQLRTPPDLGEAYFWQSLAAALDLPGTDRAALAALRDRTLSQLPPDQRDAAQDAVLHRFGDWCAANPVPPDACAAVR
ncbi:MAG: sel1 repeat family protein [Gemmobacter sp.]|nr:sel1 repeat family protein [Gemmobacter sp.]